MTTLFNDVNVLICFFGVAIFGSRLFSWFSRPLYVGWVSHIGGRESTAMAHSLARRFLPKGLRSEQLDTSLTQSHMSYPNHFIIPCTGDVSIVTNNYMVQLTSGQIGCWDIGRLLELRASTSRLPRRHGRVPVPSSVESLRLGSPWNVLSRRTIPGHG